MKKIVGFFYLMIFAFCGPLLSQQLFHIYPHGYDTICPGDYSIRVEAAPGYSAYHWSNGHQGRFLTIKSAGKYICTAIDSNQHSYKDSIMVSVYPSKPLHIYSNPTPAIICKGALLTIEASAGFKTYYWSNGHTSDHLQLYPTVSQWLKLEVTDSNECSKIDSLHIVVKNCDTCKLEITALPAKSICQQGDTIVLEATKGYSSYRWNNGHTNREMIVTQPGKYVVEAIDSNGNHCKDSIEIASGSRQLHLSFHPHPAVVCPGDTVILEANTGFLYYDWNIDGSGHRVVYIASTSKRITLHAVDSNGCISEANVDVTVRDTCPCRNIIEAHPKSNLCGMHDSLYLIARSGFSSYSWSTGSHDRTILVKSPGWYKVEVMDSNEHTCYDSIQVTRTQLPQLTVTTNPSPARICKGQKLVLEASQGFKNYYWSNQMTGARIEIYPEHSFQLVMEAVTESGCVVRKEIEIIVDSCNSLPDESGPYYINVYPNPVSNRVFTVSSGNMNISSLLLFDQAGKTVCHIENLQSSQIRVNLPAIPSGIYFLEVNINNFRMMKLVMIE